jgi:hypothetical protein
MRDGKMSLNDEFWDRVYELILHYGQGILVDDADFQEYVQAYRSPEQELRLELGSGRDVLVVNDSRMSFESEYPVTLQTGVDFAFVADNHARNVVDHFCGEARLRAWRETLQ